MKVRMLMLTALLLSQSAFGLDYEAFSQKAELRFGVTSNFASDYGFTAFIEIDNRSSVHVKPGDRDWELYIHFVRRIDSSLSDQVTIERVQGDLYRIEPTDQFEGIPSGETLKIGFEAIGFISSYSYFMPNAFIVDDAGQPYLFQNTASDNIEDYAYPLIKPEQMLRFDKPEVDSFGVTTAAERYDDAREIELSVDATTIIPTPSEVHSSRGEANIDSNWVVYQSGGLQFETDYLRANFLEQGVSLKEINEPRSDTMVSLQIDENINGDEGYELDIKSHRIDIRARTQAGIFYGVQSLLSVFPMENPQGNVRVPAMRVFDSPRYTWRGMHYDIARNFHGKEAILSLLEQMGRYKLNKLHLHLTDDEGWRLQIPGLPELTDVGGERCFDPDENDCLLTQLGGGPFKDQAGSGYLSTEDYVEILTFARERHIDVIPEIDMPGHARAAVVSMKARYRALMAEGKEKEATRYLLSDPDDTSEYLTVQSYSDNSINVCLDSTYHFIEKVVYELQSLHRQAGTRLNVFHMGGDEVGKGSWVESPVCQQLFSDTDSDVVGVEDLKPYFVRRVAEITRDRGMAVAGWEDGLMYDRNAPFVRDSLPNPQVIANAWDNIWEYGVSDRAYLLANAGYDVVISAATHLYFDHPYESNPHEKGYHWAARYTDLEKVYGFRPDDLYANARRTFSGDEIHNLDKLVNKRHTELRNPERILGIQGQLWTETVRSQEDVELMIYPRLIALAERAWHRAGWEAQAANNKAYRQDWQRFASYLVTKALPRLDRQGVHFYLPPPGLKTANNQILVNNKLPGLALEVSYDQGHSWEVVTESVVEYDQSALFRSRLGGETSRTVHMPRVQSPRMQP